MIPSFGKFSKLVKKYKMSYYAKDNYIFRYRKKGISISKKTWKSHLKAELKFMMQLLKRKKDKYGMDEIILLFCSFFT